MAHELDIATNGQARMAYSSEHGTPWHRLGTAVAGLGTIDEMLAAAGLDWMVQMSPLRIPDPTHVRRTLDVIDIDGNPHTVPDPNDPQRFMEPADAFTWRINPDTGHGDFFGVVGEGYQVIQARTMLEVGMQVAGIAPGAKAIDTLGSLRNGASVFATIPLPDFILDPQGIGEAYARQYSLLTDHTGRSAFKLLRSDTRVVCANTARFAQSAAKWSVSIKHTKAAAEIPVAWVKDQLGFLTTADEQFEAMMYNMLGTSGDWATVTTMADKLWPTKTDGEGNTTKRMAANRDKRMARLGEIWELESGRAGSNGHAVYQTIQGYMQHDQGNTSDRKRIERSVAGSQGATFQRNCQAVAELVLAG